MSLLTVVAMLGGIAALLWFSAVFEARHLGQVATASALDPADAGSSDTPLPDAVPDPGAPALRVIEAA
jgi:hypothetical protein